MCPPKGGTRHANDHKQPCQREPNPEYSTEVKPARLRPEQPSHCALHGLPIQMLVPRLCRQPLPCPLCRREMRCAGSAGGQVHIESPALVGGQSALQRHIQARLWVQNNVHRNTPAVSGE